MPFAVCLAAYRTALRYVLLIIYAMSVLLLGDILSNCHCCSCVDSKALASFAKKSSFEKPNQKNIFAETG